MGEALFGAVPGPLAKASSPFGGGVGGSREEMCGLLSGGVLLIGALLGRELPDRPDDEAQRLAQAWRDRFLQALGATRCGTLRDGLPDQPHRCRPLVREGVALLRDILVDEGWLAP